ncbi:MAG TPA: hypothetical protein VK935_22375, partial [Actinomycetospora sp.]|nr:hypothetical protein [Actinomycetospora sp.]
TALGDPAPAAALLAAADTDPFAPRVLGPDLERQESLRTRILAELPAARLAQARADGAAVGRAGAAELALRALSQHR